MKNIVKKMAFSALEVRAIIGFIGILFPLILTIGNGGLEASISDFYYTPMRDVFVVVLGFLALSFFSYKGYDKTENYITFVAGIAALGVALVGDKTNINYIHFGSAIILFIIMAYMSVFRFTKSKNKQANIVYKVSGYYMFAIILILIGVFLFGDRDRFTEFHLIFWLEVNLLIPFGISWLTKAKVIFNEIKK
jgi:hypothetical protein